MVVNNDPRPKNLDQYIKKFRVTIPPDLTEFADEVGPKGPRNGSIGAGLEPYTGPWTSTQITHLLKRTMYGVRKEDINAFTGSTMEQSVDRILTKSSRPSLPVNDYNNTDFDGIFVDPDVPFGQTWINSKWNFESEGYKILSMKAYNIERVLDQNRSITEKLIMFWHNHMPIQTWDVYFGKAIWPYFRTLRDHAFGNFKSMIKDITTNSAMLMYLNGASNNKDAPDENYAREMQELFCIGKGPNANFTEEDVRAAARVLTGWSVNWAGYVENGTPFNSLFYQGLHDTEDKQFSSFYGNRVIEGRTTGGEDELDELIDMILETNECALFICRKIYQFFVYSEIDQDTETNVIVPLAQILRDNDYEIKPVLEALFKSAHFFDPLNYGAMIKTPFDAVLGYWRMWGMPYVQNDLRGRYSVHLGGLWQIGSLGQEMNDPPSVSGYPAYYQIPSFDKLWITTQTITSRTTQTDSFIHWTFWNPAGIRVAADVLAFTERMDNPSDPNTLIQEIVEMALGVDVDAVTKLTLKAILLSGQANDSYWTDAWTDYISDPNNQTFKMIVETRLKFFYQSLFHLAEYQLM